MKKGMKGGTSAPRGVELYRKIKWHFLWPTVYNHSAILTKTPYCLFSHENWNHIKLTVTSANNDRRVIAIAQHSEPYA